MPKLYSLQPAPRVDHVDADGHEFTQKPYPWHILADGEVQQKGFWKGAVTDIIGFTEQAHKPMALLWSDVEDPQEVVGKYIVYLNAKGNAFVSDTVVETVTVQEYTDEQLEHLNG